MTSLEAASTAGKFGGVTSGAAATAGSSLTSIIVAVSVTALVATAAIAGTVSYVFISRSEKTGNFFKNLKKRERKG